MSQKENTVAGNIFGLLLFTAIPWVAALNGASHYVMDDSLKNRLFLQNLTEQGPLGILMSFSYSYSIGMLIVFTIALLIIAVRNKPDEKEGGFLVVVFWICIVSLNLSAIPLAFFYDSSDPPIMSLLIYGSALIPLVFISIKDALFS